MKLPWWQLILLAFLIFVLAPIFREFSDRAVRDILGLPPGGGG